MTTRAPSDSSNRAAADPSPPAPPTSSISRPSMDDFSARNFRSLLGDVSESDRTEKQRHHFRVAQVVLQKSFRENLQNHGDRAVQHKPRFLIRPLSPQRLGEVPQNLPNHPHQN